MRSLKCRINHISLAMGWCGVQRRAANRRLPKFRRRRTSGSGSRRAPVPALCLSSPTTPAVILPPHYNTSSAAFAAHAPFADALPSAHPLEIRLPPCVCGTLFPAIDLHHRALGFPPTNSRINAFRAALLRLAAGFLATANCSLDFSTPHATTEISHAGEQLMQHHPSRVSIRPSWPTPAQMR